MSVEQMQKFAGALMDLEEIPHVWEALGIDTTLSPNEEYFYNNLTKKDTPSKLEEFFAQETELSLLEKIALGDFTGEELIQKVEEANKLVSEVISRYPDDTVKISALAKKYKIFKITSFL